MVRLSSSADVFHVLFDLMKKDFWTLLFHILYHSVRLFGICVVLSNVIVSGIFIYFCFLV